MLGSVTPVYITWGDIAHYVYTDSSGTEYRLDVKTGNTWTGREGAGVAYEADTGRLRFQDGSLWVMGCEVAEFEEDAGTYYPTLVQDSHGNQIKVDYAAGFPWAAEDSSSRVLRVWDMRSSPTEATWRFWYDGTRRLSYVTGPVGYTFTYRAALPLMSPFDDAPLSAVVPLETVETVGTGRKQKFEYGLRLVNGLYYTTGEMEKTTLPYGGTIRWVMRSFQYAGNRSAREIQERFLKTAAGGTETRHWLWRDDAADAQRAYHVAVALGQDTPAGGTASGDRVYWFDAAGKLTAFQERWPVSLAIHGQTDLTWSALGDGTPYVQESRSRRFEAGGTVESVTTVQSVDPYGHPLLVAQSSGGQTRTTTYEWLHTGAQNPYAARYIRNRLKKVSVTGAGGTFVPFIAEYDGAQVATGGLPVSGLSLHNTAEYGPGFTLRGVATRVTRGSAVRQVHRIDYAGHALQTSGPEGTVTAVVDWHWGYARPDSVSANGVGTTLQWDSAMRLTASVGAAGDTATFGWDVEGRPATRKLPDGTEARVEYSYAPAVTKEIVRNHRWTKTHLDGLGRPVKVERGHGGVARTDGGATLPEVVESVTEMQYIPCACGPFGKLWKESLPHAPGAAAVWTEHVYDAFGRTEKVKHAVGGESLQSYGAGPSPGGTGTLAWVRSADAAGRWKKRWTDGFGDLREVTEPRPGGGADYVSKYSYNALGKLTNVSMTRNGRKNGTAQEVTQTRTFVYNPGGELDSVTMPETGTTSYTYEQGRTKTKTDAMGRKVEWVYNAASGRLTEIKHFYSGVETVAERTTYTYGLYGRLASATYGSPAGPVTESYGWSAAGQMTSKTLGFLGTTVAAGWEYDAEGRLSAVTYPQGGRFGYGWDAAGRESSLKHPDQTVHATATWAPVLGVMTGLARPDGWSQSWGYGADGLMSPTE